MVSSSLMCALAALLQQEPGSEDGSITVVRVAAGIGALVLIAIVILRRRSKKKTEDPF